MKDYINKSLVRYKHLKKPKQKIKFIEWNTNLIYSLTTKNKICDRSYILHCQLTWCLIEFYSLYQKKQINILQEKTQKRI